MIKRIAIASLLGLSLAMMQQIFIATGLTYVKT